jgi:hypothetical protein
LEFRGNSSELLHFGLWVEMNILMEFLSREEQAQLLTALQISRREYELVSARYLEAVDTNTEPARTALFLEARADAARGGRERAIERYNRFLDGLNSSN